MADQDRAPTLDLMGEPGGFRGSPSEPPPTRPEGEDAPSLSGLNLAEAPYQLDFFDVLRRVECAYPRKARLGKAARPVDEPVRLGQEPSLGFAPSTLAYYTPPTAGRPARLGVHFMGAFGPNGPLPLHLTEYARDRLRNANDPTFVRFLDVFHHRALSLFYRAWADAQPVVGRDRPGEDRFATYVGALLGLGSPALRDRDGFPDTAKLYFAGRLSAQARNAEGLEAMLGEYFGLPVRIEEFVGEWLPLPDRDRWRLGRANRAGALGIGSVLGARAWHRQGKFRVAFGPLTSEQFQSLLPGGARLPRLVAAVRNYTGDSLDWDVRLTVNERAEEVFRPGLTRLGWTTWLGRCPEGRRRQDVILNPLHGGAVESPQTGG